MTEAVPIGELTPGPGERYGIFGGTRAGKSALLEWSLRHVQRTRPTCLVVLVDSKPRFRTEYRQGLVRGSRRSAAPLYETWAKGPTVPNSVRVDLAASRPFSGLWKNPGEIAVMQSGDEEDWKRMLVLLNAFVRANIKGRERLVVIDECLDFYQRNSLGIDTRNDVFYRVARAGGERNIGLWIGAQKLRGIPPLMLNCLSRITLFHLRTDSEMNYLRDIGVPDAESPEGNYIFRQYRVEPGGTVSTPLTGRVTYPESYLNQLSST